MYKHGESNILQTPLLDGRGSQLAHTFPNLRKFLVFGMQWGYEQGRVGQEQWQQRGWRREIKDGLLEKVTHEWSC